MGTVSTHTLIVTVNRPELMDEIEVRINEAPLRVYDANQKGYRDFPREIHRNGTSFEVNFQADDQEAASAFGKIKDSLSRGVMDVSVSYRRPSAAQQAA